MSKVSFVYFISISFLYPAFIVAQEKPASPEKKSTDFFKKFNFKLKTFEQNNSTIGAALGFSYSYDEPTPIKVIQAPTKNNQHTKIDLFYSITARGNVAFNSRNNPEDFLETILSVGVDYSRPEYQTISQKNRLYEQEMALKLSGLETTDPEYIELNKTLEDYLKSIPIISALGINGRMYIGMESDQKFVKKQRIYGMSLTTHYQAYHKAERFRDTTLAAKINLLDYPFALIRMFSGENFVPSASALPSLVIGYARVEPGDNDPRLIAGDDSPFHRLNASLSFKTRLGIADKNKNPIYFTANTRYYKELNPKTSVVTAGLDSYHYSVYTIESDNTYVSYATGQLPLDDNRDTVYEIGWKYTLD